MRTVTFIELEKCQEKLHRGNYVLRIESWDSNEQIGKRIRHFLEKSGGAPIIVEYDLITDDMKKSLNEFNP